jgi:DNA repair exonuclease SbcCD ATPase subunit
MELMLLGLIGLLLVATIAVFLRQQMGNRRGHAIRELLDGADALEAQLLDYRSRMQSLKQALARLPNELDASAITRLDPETQVQQALRDVLAHRLWIKRESETATQHALDSAVEAIAKSRRQLSEQLRLLDEVSSQLAAASAELRATFQQVSAARNAVAKAQARSAPQPPASGPEGEAPRPRGKDSTGAPPNPTLH